MFMPHRHTYTRVSALTRSSTSSLRVREYVQTRLLELKLAVHIWRTRYTGEEYNDVGFDYPELKFRAIRISKKYM